MCHGRRASGESRTASTTGYESYPELFDLRDRNRSFDGLAAINIRWSGWTPAKIPRVSWLMPVSGNYFDVLDIQPYLGRFFHSSDEHGPNSVPYIVLSYGYWHIIFRTIAEWWAGRSG